MHPLALKRVCVLIERSRALNAAAGGTKGRNQRILNFSDFFNFFNFFGEIDAESRFKLHSQRPSLIFLRGSIRMCTRRTLPD